MRIKIDDIPEEGLEFEIEPDDAWAIAAAAAALEGDVVDLGFELQIERIAELVRVHGHFHGAVDRTCDRCGGELRLQVQGPVELLFEPHRHEALHEEHITDPSELDIGFFDGVALDMAEVVSEQLALALPPRLVCGGPGVTQRGGSWTCELPAQDAGPDLSTHKPFANLRLPE
ncbi:MAG: DUF177 domain-containing protein [Alphaproteobacteria bacterium]|nr:DUF177 domain-containing protein [Alphaproteobacteria bacterium]